MSARPRQPRSSLRRRLTLPVVLALALFALAGAAALAGPLLPGVSLRGMLGLARPTPPCTPTAEGLRFPRSGPASRRWRELAPFPVARDELRAAAVGGRIYVGSGIDPDPGVFGGIRSLGELYELDAAEGTFRKLPHMPLRVDHPALVGHGGALYLFGGWRDGRASAAAWRFTPSSGRWSELAPMRVPRGAAAAAAVGDRIYVVGGSVHDHERAHLPGSRVVEVYDVAADRWTRGPDLPTPRHHHGAAALGGRIYAVGGRHGAAMALAVVERLDPASGRWEPQPPLPLRAGGVAVVAAGGAIVAAGGGDDAGGWVTPAAWAYGPGRGWRRLADLNVARHGHGAAALGDSAYVFGGSPCAGYGRTDSVEALPLG